MMDYSTLTDDQLDIEIARRRGWSETHESVHFGLLGHDETGELQQPKWSYDLSRAMLLFYEIPDAWLHVDRNTGDYHVNTADTTYLGRDTLCCRAIDYAWLAWTDRFPTPAMLADASVAPDA